MRIGTFLDTSGGPAAVHDAIAAAGRRGLDAAWTNQLPGSWDPLALLAGAGPDRGPAELGTAVTLTAPVHPAALAANALTVQAAVGGRLTLGVGPGHGWFVTDQLGLPYNAVAARTREYLEILRPLLHGEQVTHRGRFHTVDTRITVPGPPPRLLLSALGPRMLAVAGELTDGTVATWVRPDLVADHLRPALPDTARIVVSVVTVVTSDPDAARAGIERTFGVAADMPAYRAVLDRGGLTRIAETVVAGDEETVAAELRRFADAGATDLVLVAAGEHPERVLDVADALRTP
ncbi:TIGR03564 family F420-dependent LLM class oxidoreductase [Pseudonocardia sp. NPDC046786]|uniref:TIGR03564 family F420-dependent LLM class oxidoreductase n=1 Tax=Pseudonocardia sp. NPDC046786 TaxID=3155471 RepID=UPI0033D82737